MLTFVSSSSCPVFFRRWCPLREEVLTGEESLRLHPAAAHRTNPYKNKLHLIDSELVLSGEANKPTAHHPGLNTQRGFV